MAQRAHWGKYALSSTVALVLLGGLGACSKAEPTGPTTTPGRQTAYSVTPSPVPSKSSAPAPSPVKNDLEELPLRRTLNAGPVTAAVSYQTGLALTEWRALTTKPLLVTFSASNRDKRSQKIYLTKVTMNVTAYDESGQLDVPQTIVDSASLQPGFIVKSPNSYNQNFDIPAVDRAAVRITIDMTYELLLEVNRGAEGERDLAKQVATDKLSVPIVTS